MIINTISNVAQWLNMNLIAAHAQIITMNLPGFEAVGKSALEEIKGYAWLLAAVALAVEALLCLFSKKARESAGKAFMWILGCSFVLIGAIEIGRFVEGKVSLR